VARIETLAQAKRIDAGEVIKQEGFTLVSNEGQSCIALVPRWANWGATLQNGKKLIEGRTYKIIIEVEDE